MGTTLQIVVVYVLPAVGAFFWFYWSELPSRIALVARALAIFGALAMLSSIGAVASKGTYATSIWAVGALLGVLAAVPKAMRASLLGESGYLLGTAGTAAAGVVMIGVGMTLASSARSAQPSPMSLAFPLRSGRYLVLGGGEGLLGIEPHGISERYAIDLVKVDGAGFRASTLWPTAPEEFFAFDEPVSAPCDGNVLAAEDDRPDLPPSQSDSTSPLGNFVAIGCPEATVVLAHLKRGTITAPKNSGVRVGEPVARIGASGHAGQAKLRIYAVKGAESTLGRLVSQATPVAISFGEGALVRGDTVSR